MSSYLIVAATASEAAYVPSHLPAVVTGIGKTAAACALARVLATTDRTDLEIINIGTAGALRDDLSGLFEPGQVINHDISAEEIRALGHDPQEHLVVNDGEVVLASGDVFVTDPAVRLRLATQAHLVDMEGYAVTWTARQFDLPVRLVKHVSDNADESAFDWPSVVDASARVLGEWLGDTLVG